MVNTAGSIVSGLVVSLLLFGFANAYTSSGNAFYCNSCEDCTAALNDNGHNIVYLENDVQAKGTCIEVIIENFTDKVFDCKGHKIIGPLNLDDPELSCGICVGFGITFDPSTNRVVTETAFPSNSKINNCDISGFADAIILTEYASHMVVSNNVIHHNIDGIISAAPNSTITNNVAYDNTEDSFRIMSDVLFGSDFYNADNYLIENVAYNSGTGFNICSRDTKLVNNTAYDNSKNGFYIDRDGIILTNNVAYNNLQHGFHLDPPYHSIIISNTAYKNKGDGFCVEGKNNTLRNNVAYDNSKNGFNLNDADSSFFINNLAHDNADNGFYFFQPYLHVLINNTANKNKNGFYFEHVEFSNFTNNRASNNSEYGLHLGYVSHHNSLINNIFCNNDVDIHKDESDPLLNYAHDNICDNAVNWNDEGRNGCTYTCSEVDISDSSIIDSVISGITSFIDDLINGILSFLNPDYEPEVEESDSIADVTGPTPDFYIVTSFNRICPESKFGNDCPYNEKIDELKTSLEAEGYIVRVVNFQLEGNWKSFDDIELVADDTSATFREQAPVLDKNTYVLIFGSYAAIPPCVYRDQTEKSFFAIDEEEVFISDDCYGTSNDGPSEAIISRIPHVPTGKSLNYLDAMANYHSERSRGVYGLNDYRLSNEYSKPCPNHLMTFYYIFTLPNMIKHFDYNEVETEQYRYMRFDEPVFIWEAGSDNQGTNHNAYPIQYYSAHGSPNRPEWIDEDGKTVLYPSPQDYSFLAVSLACYGGYLTGDSIAETWLFQNTYWNNAPNVFIGSTDFSYFDSGYIRPIGGDLLLNKFHEEFDSGNTAGEALLSAKKYVYSHKYEGLSSWVFTDNNEACVKNQKVAVEYQLYGDPLLTKADMINSKDLGCMKIE